MSHWFRSRQTLATLAALTLGAVLLCQPALAQLVTSSANLDIQNFAIVSEMTNAASNFPSANQLAILSGATVQVATTTTTSGVIGICVNNCTASASNAQIAREGTVLCAFDSGGTTAGDYVQVSTTTTGDCHDTSSSTYPVNGSQVLGRALSSNSGSGSYSILLYPGETVPFARGCLSSCRYLLGFVDGAGFVLSGGAAVATANNVYLAQFYNPITRKVGNGYSWVGTAGTGGHFDVGVYDSTGTLQWSSGQKSTGTMGLVSFTPTAYTMNPGVYYLAYCADNTSAILAAIVNFTSASNQSNFFGGTGTTANTFGADSNVSDVCTNGTLQSSITLSHISQSNMVQIAAVMVTN